MTERLGHKQTAAMLALMTLAREVSNPELRTIVGFVLDGEERRGLNDNGFVASRKQGNCYVHELTEQGWAWCDEELGARTPPPPKPRSTLVAALYLALGGFADHARRERLRPADIFAPAATTDGRPTVDAPVEVATADDIESRIRAAYGELAKAPRDWVGLARLRPLLGDTPAKEVDAVLKKLSRAGLVRLVPESNRKALTAAHHESAIRIGGEDNHLISIEAS